MPEVHEQATPAGSLAGWRVGLAKRGEGPASALVSELVAGLVNAAGAKAAAGALLAALSEFSYDAQAGTLSLDLSAYATDAELSAAIAALKGPVAADRDTLAELAAAVADVEGKATAAPVGYGLQPLATWEPPSDSTPSAGGNTDTGIALPDAPADNDMYAFATRFGGLIGLFRPLRGKTIKAIPVSTAGNTDQGFLLSEDAGANGGLYAAKLVSGSLLLSHDAGAWDPATDYFTLYRLSEPGDAAAPSISRFELEGDLSPAPGAINETYRYEFAVAQSSHLSALRIVRFAGTAAAPAAVTVLATIARADWHGGSGRVAVSGFSLAAGATQTVRLEGYSAGQVPATDQPATYHDARITAATAAARGRLVGWSAAAVPTAAEIAAATLASGDVLAIPRRASGQDAHIFFGVPADPGLPSELYFSNNPSLNQFAFFGERAEAAAGDFTRSGVAYKVMSTDNSLFAATYGTGDVSLRLVRA